MKDWHELLPVIREIYDRHLCGCCWHIVLDDLNIDRESVQFCGWWALNNQCRPCIDAWFVISTASKTQLRKAIHFK